MSFTPQPPSEHQPHRTFASDQVIVIDNFLDKETLEKVHGYSASAQYHVVHERGWRKVWRPHDGYPLQGETVLCLQNPTVHPDDPKCTVYPNGTNIDLFIDRLSTILPQVENITGVRGEHWDDYTCAPWVYPTGTGLSLHQDGLALSGAYTYFVHKQWNLHWGGYLLVLDASTPKVATPSDIPMLWLDDNSENTRVWDPGLALCILPKPNRLVFISPDTQHLISRVDAAAGHHSRLSLAGFFLRRPI